MRHNPGALQVTVTLLTLTAFLSLGLAEADDTTTPSAPAASPTLPSIPGLPSLTGSSGSSDPVGDTLNSGISAIDTASNTFGSIDSTINMLSGAIDILSGIPVIGPFALMLKPVLNSYLDFRATTQPLMDAMTHGREYLQRAVDAKNTVQQMFSSSNFGDGLNSLNSLVNQFGGLANLKASDRVIDRSNPRASVQKILQAADQELVNIQQGREAAKASGDVNTYRYLAQKAIQMQQLRTRINAAGQTAAAEVDSAKLVARSSKSAQNTATRTEGFANTLSMTKSAEGAIKALGTVAIEQMNATSSGFDTLSQQLALISQQQTVTNEQSDQLLQHFQTEQAERDAKVRMVLTQEEKRQTQAYTANIKRVNSLADSIGQTMKQEGPTSDVRHLMQGLPQ